MLKHCTIESNYRYSLSSLRGEGGGGRSLKSECSSHLSHTRERERGVFGFELRLMRIQLFQERLSEKVHATIPKGIVGDFEFFEEISKNCTRSHAPMFASAKGKQHK